MWGSWAAGDLGVRVAAGRRSRPASGVSPSVLSHRSLFELFPETRANGLPRHDHPRAGLAVGGASRRRFIHLWEADASLARRRHDPGKVGGVRDTWAGSREEQPTVSRAGRLTGAAVGGDDRATNEQAAIFGERARHTRPDRGARQRPRAVCPGCATTSRPWPTTSSPGETNVASPRRRQVGDPTRSYKALAGRLSRPVDTTFRWCSHRSSRAVSSRCASPSRNLRGWTGPTMSRPMSITPATTR